MYLLAGLFGLMALASLTLAGLSMVPVRAPPRGDMGGSPPAQNNDDGSLFARMGLLDMPWSDHLAGADRVSEPDGSSGGPGPVEGAAPWLDYDAAEDHLVVIYDDRGGCGDPQVALVPREGDPSVTEILLGGRVLACLPTAAAPPLSAIFLVGESAASALAAA